MNGTQRQLLAINDISTVDDPDGTPTVEWLESRGWRWQSGGYVNRDGQVKVVIDPAPEFGHRETGVLVGCNAGVWRLLSTKPRRLDVVFHEWSVSYNPLA